MAKPKKLLHDGVYGKTGRYVRAWQQGREYCVQVWNGPTADGEPKGDWAMPKVLGLDASIDQAVRQTPKEK